MFDGIETVQPNKKMEIANKCLHDLFEEQVKNSQDKVAVVGHDGHKLNFGELKQLSDVLSENLQHKGCTRDSIVGIYMEKSLNYVLSYVSILKAGGAYLPIELSYPQPLLESVIEDSSPVAVITTPEYKTQLPPGLVLIVLEEGWEPILVEENMSYQRELPPVTSQLDDLAYVVYSSGTTGKPKGIMCPHRGAVFSYSWRHLHYPYADDDRVACNVFFTWELMRPLLKGTTLFVIPDTVIYDPPLLLKFFYENKITRVLLTPSLLEAVLDAQDIDLALHLSTMRLIVLCGEVVTMALRNRFIQQFPNIKLINLYSISECHDVAVSDLSLGELEKTTLHRENEKRKFCPVGKVFDEVKVLIFDNDLNQMPIGMPGEIFVAGPTLARGYLKRPELTASRFLRQFLHNNEDKSTRLYRTGDWGYLLSTGELEICGRCDSMVKIRGYSIEIQAVESALLSLPLVNACTVLAHGDEGSEKYLVAYVVPNEQASKKEIRAALKARLPFHMIPSYFVLLNSVPISTSGKLDKKVLPAFNRDEETDTADEALPSTDTEKRIYEIWKRVLQLKNLDIQENFFDLGGHSLLAARMLSEVRDEFSVDVPMTQLFRHNTVTDFSLLLDQMSGIASKTRSAIDAKLDLLQEVQNHDQGFVNMDIMLRAFWRSCQYGHRWENGRVLLTGATGFLGAFILRDLLLHTKVHVYCIIRELPDSKAYERVLHNCRKYGVLPDEGESFSNEQEHLWIMFQKRVTAVKGDISLVNLGLSEEEYAHFAVEIDFIVHAAAAVNLIFPYKALHGPNVLGTQQVLMFACTSKIKPVHYISTNAVFPENLKDCAEDADMLEFYDKLEDGYSQTKWVAEQLVARAGKRGLPIAIYRLGNLSGELANGYWNPVDFNFLMIKGCLLAGTAPTVDWLIEMTPVDFVSKIIVRFTQNITLSLGKTFHLVNADTMDSKLLFEWISIHGYPLKMVPFIEWKKQIRSYSGSDESMKLLGQMLDTLVENEQFFEKQSSFKNEKLLKVLDDLNMVYPSTAIATIEHYMKCFVERKIIPLPRKQTFENNLLTGKVVLVTGASSGIGASVAKYLAKSGASVALTARRLDRLEEVRNSIVEDGHVAIALKADVVNKSEMLEVVHLTQEMFGPLDVLVCCAGVMYFTLMKNLHVDEWERTVDVNCKGLLNSIGAVLPGMLERKKGHIVSISSDAGRKVFPGLSVYSASKFFVEALSQGLRLETASCGIKITTIQPGDVRTELIQHTTDKEAKKQFDMSEKTTTILEPEDVAKAVLFSVSQPEHCAINEILVEPREAPA